MESGNVLILEPDNDLRLSMTEALSVEGYQVTGTADIDDTVKAARQHHDLLILSVRETEILDTLLAELTPDMSVLILAKNQVIGKAAIHAGTGIRSFLPRPLTPSRLKKEVARIIKRTNQVKANIRQEVLAPLQHVSQVLTEKADADQLLSRIVANAAALSGADCVLVSVKDDSSGERITRARTGDCPPSWRKPLDEVARMGAEFILDEESPDNPYLYDLMTAAGISALMSVPLIIDGEISGSIDFIKESSPRFSAPDLELASVIGQWCSLILGNARLMEEVGQQHRHVERLQEAVAVAQENERRRVAIEIHDGVAQWMVGASFNIKACSNLIAENRMDDLEEELKAIRETIQKSIRELRRAIADLRPLPLEELGLTAAVSKAAEELQEEGISCQTDITGDLPQMTLAEESTIYWIIQETLTNIRKHSEASAVRLRVEYNNGLLKVDVTDNGRGFLPEQVINGSMSSAHLGLRGMMERAELLDGKLTITSKPGKGTSISLALPISAQAVSKTMA